MGSRDRFLGWSAAARRRNLRFLAYNTRFLILPWVEVPHLASHLLGRMAKRLAADWERVYQHPIYLLETFVDPTRFRGTCHRVANWIVLDGPRGRAKTIRPIVRIAPIKEVLGYPLRQQLFAYAICSLGSISPFSPRPCLFTSPSRSLSW